MISVEAEESGARVENVGGGRRVPVTVDCGGSVWPAHECCPGSLLVTMKSNHRKVKKE